MVRGWFRKNILVGILTVAAAMGVAVGASAALVPTVTPQFSMTEGLSTPVRVVADAAGTIYATDPRTGGIVKLSGSGKLQQIIPTVKPPQGIAVTSAGTLIVGQGDFVSILDQNGRELRRLGSGAGQFKLANGIALDGAGKIFVTDSLDNCVKVFSASGDYLSRFGSAGAGSGQLSMPTGIAFEKSANQVAVVDTLNGRIQFFDTNGVYLKTIGSAGSGPLKLTFPLGVAFGYTKDAVPQLQAMYVADSFQSTVQVIDPAGSGAFLAFVGGYGSSAGQLVTPSDVTIDQVGSRLIVANGVGNLAVYAIGSSSTTVDTIPPTLTVDPLASSTTSSSLTLSGTVEAGASVTVSVNGSAARTATVNGTVWNISVTLIGGANTIAVRATDAAGNAATSSVGITLTGPAAAFAVDPVPTLVKTPVVTITGTKGSGSIITVTTGTSAVAGALSYPTATTWRCDVTGLVEGANPITITDGSATETLVVSLDTLAPSLVVSALPNNSAAAAQVQNVTVRVSEPHLDKVTINGIPSAVANGVASAAVTLVYGSNTIAVVATDQAGNAASDSRTINFAATRPALSITTPADGASTKTAVVELSGTTGANTTVTVNDAPALTTGTTWSKRVPLTVGLNTIVVTARDLAGNTSQLKRSVSFDGVLPQVAINAPSQDLATNAATASFSGTAEAGSTVAYSVNGVTTPVSAANGDFSFTVPLAREGAYAVAVTVTDAVGNTSVTTRNLVFDPAPPALMITSPTNPLPTVLTGIAGQEAAVTVADKSGTLGTATVADGRWSFDLSGTSYDVATIMVTGTDAAGNTMTRTLAAPAPTGDVTGDGQVTIADALRALRVYLGMSAPTFADYANGDVGPFVNGSIQPNGTIDLSDAVLLLRRAVGVTTW